jgi:hypothetical protein
MVERSVRACLAQFASLICIGFTEVSREAGPNNIGKVTIGGRESRANEMRGLIAGLARLILSVGTDRRPFSHGKYHRHEVVAIGLRQIRHFLHVA